MPRELAARVASHTGKEINFGIRPENVMVKGHTNVPEDENVVTSKVNVVEPLGDEQIIYLEAAGQDFIAKVDSHVRLKVGDSVPMIFDLAKAHIFDVASGANVSLSDSAQVA